MPEDTGIQKGAKGVTSTAGNLVSFIDLLVQQQF
jgi:hypothetical protein